MVKNVVAWLRELAPTAKGSQNAESHNLDHPYIMRYVFTDQRLNYILLYKQDLV